MLERYPAVLVADFADVTTEEDVFGFLYLGWIFPSARRSFPLLFLNGLIIRRCREDVGRHPSQASHG